LEKTKQSLADFEANPDVYIARIHGSIGVEPGLYREG
jgi:hypothetical protein